MANRDGVAWAADGIDHRRQVRARVRPRSAAGQGHVGCVPRPCLWRTTCRGPAFLGLLCAGDPLVMNIAVVSLDSLRYDVAVNTPTPNLDGIFRRYEAGSWRR